MYESYADMEAGAWTTMRIEVAGTKARLYVNGASQPCLVVNDLKHGDRPGTNRAVGARGDRRLFRSDQRLGAVTDDSPQRRTLLPRLLQQLRQLCAYPLDLRFHLRFGIWT